MLTKFLWKILAWYILILIIWVVLSNLLRFLKFKNKILDKKKLYNFLNFKG